MSTFQDTFSGSTNLSETLGSEVVSGELRPINHDDGTTLSFNGSTQYGAATGYKGVTGTSARTTMGWFKTLTTATQGVLYYFGADGGVVVQYQVTIETDGVMFLRMGGNVISWGENLNDGQWHHIAITNPASANVTGFDVYLDGLPATGSIVANSGHTINLTSQADVSVAARKETVAAAENLFNGSIDDLRFYNAELTADQIADLVINGTEPPTANLQAQWLFNEGAGALVTDNANSNNLSLVNSPTWTTTHKPFYATQTASTSTELVTDVSSIESFKYTTSKKSGGVTGRLQFSEDGSTWFNANGDSLTGSIYEFGDLTNTASATQTVLDFNGSSDRVTISDANAFSFGNGSTDSPFSISAWIYMHDAYRFKILMKDGAGAGDAEYRFHVDAFHQLYLMLFDSDGEIISVYSEPLTHLENQWIHVAGTYDGSGSTSGLKLYINGNLVNIGTYTYLTYSAMSNTSQIVEIGGWDSESQWADGLIANVAVWSDVRTQAEIIQEVENGFADTGNGNLVAYYPLDGNADDYLGNYDGTISGANTTVDIYRPAPIQPTQTTIDVSGLGYTSFYYRYVTDSTNSQLITALTEVSLDYTFVPDILIKDSGGDAIADGEATPIDFGLVAQGGSELEESFTIENNGEATLTISSINLPTGYSISGATPTTIASGGSETFIVALSTATVGVFSGDIEVNSNDPDTALYNFAITGEVIALQNIVIKDGGGDTIADGETTPQDFGNADQSATSPTLTFTIENTGDVALTISSITLPTGYSISGDTPSTILGGESDTFTVELSTDTVGVFSGDIEVNSNDPDLAIYNFAITGTINLVEPEGTLESNLITFLANKEDLPDIYPVRLPRDATKPCLSVWRYGAEGGHSLSGASSLGVAFIQISVWSESSKEAKETTKILQGYLQNYQGLMGTRYIGSIRAEDELETYEPPQDGKQKGVWQIICQYRILHREALPALSIPSEAITNSAPDIGITDYIKTALDVDVYNSSFPQEDLILPAIIYRKSNNRHVHSLATAVNKALTSFEFDCHASTSKEAIELGESLRLILQGFRGVLDGCQICGSKYTNQSQRFIRPITGNEIGRFICTMSFDFLVTE